MKKSLAVAGILGLLWVGDTSRTWAGELAPQVRFDIPAQALATALLEFSKQADVQIIVSNDIARGHTSHAVRGEYSTERALDLLLEGSGLNYRLTDERTIAIAVSEPSEVRSNAPARSSGARAQLEEIVVTGSHIRGVEYGASSISTYTRDDIQRTGQNDVAGLLRTLPQNFSGGAYGATPDGLLGDGSFARYNVGGATSPNLRGLGNGSTLTLINGHRVAPVAQASITDIGLIPLSAIERVDILSDGASAVYGSDAIGGVVNIILRRRFDGLETSMEGVTDRGGDYSQLKFAQTAGLSWNSGDALISASYDRSNPLPASKRSFSSDLPIADTPAGRIEAQLYPRERNYALFATGRQSLAPALEMSFDGWFGHRDRQQAIVSAYSPVDYYSATFPTQSDESSLSLGAVAGLGGSWRLTTDAVYGHVSQRGQETDVFPGIPTFRFAARTHASIYSFSSQLDGDTVTLPAGAIKVAVGAEYRKEDYLDRQRKLVALTEFISASARHITSAFTEAHVPLLAPDQGVTWAHEVALSLALRYDDYSDVGNTTNYKAGLSWAPATSLTLRGTYSTSFRAPDLGLATRSGRLSLSPNLSNFTAPDGTGTVSVVFVGGTQVLRPETSSAVTAGFDLRPERLPQLKLGGTWFRYDYIDRLSSPPYDTDILLKLDQYGPLVTPVTSAAQVQQFEAAVVAGQGTSFLDGQYEGFQYIIDNTLQNLGGQRVNGVDFTASYAYALAGREASSTLAVTRLIDDVQRVTPVANPIQLLRMVGNQPTMRVRASTTLAVRAATLTASGNYTSGFENQNVAGRPDVNDWLTFDLNARLPLPQVLGEGEVALSVLNVFDRDPPFVLRNFSGPYYDTANANPLGRTVSLRLVKHW